MKNFKVEVSKGLEKFYLIRKSESETTLKQELHKEGFSVLSILLLDQVEIEGNKFYFEIKQNGEIKMGTIMSPDIFKAYLKIKDNLKYDLQYIYYHKDASLEEKQKVMHELQEQYRVYLESHKKEIQKQVEIQKQKTKVVEEVKVETFQMQKELSEVYEIINKVLDKLKYLVEKPDNTFLTSEKKEKLKEIYTNILKIKNSTNIPKLKQIGEGALKKIGEIELQMLEASKDIESKKLLSETNKLLKEVGSKTTFITKDKDIGYILKTFFQDFSAIFSSNKPKKTEFKIDTKSSSYLKTKLLIEKYEKKMETLNKDIRSKFYIYLIPSKKNNLLKDQFYLRKKVIHQNLMILQSRLSGKSYSYTKIIKGYHTLIEKILLIVDFFKNPLLFLLLAYSLTFIIFNFFSFLGLYQFHINFYGLFYFLFLNAVFIFMQYVRGVISLSFNIVILSFLFIFGVINF